MQKTVQKIQPVFLSFNDGSSSQCSPHLLIVPLGISLSSFLALFFLLSFLVLFCTVYIRVRFVLVLYNQEIESLTRIKYRWASQREREREREGGGGGKKDEPSEEERRKKELAMLVWNIKDPNRLANSRRINYVQLCIRKWNRKVSPRVQSVLPLSISLCLHVRFLRI